MYSLYLLYIYYVSTSPAQPSQILYLFVTAIALRQWPSSAPGPAHVPDHNEGGGVWGPQPPRGPVAENKNKLFYFLF